MSAYAELHYAERKLAEWDADQGEALDWFAGYLEANADSMAEFASERAAFGDGPPGSAAREAAYRKIEARWRKLADERAKLVEAVNYSWHDVNAEAAADAAYDESQAPF